jgi:hypothetical protein
MWDHPEIWFTWGSSDYSCEAGPIGLLITAACGAQQA